MTLSPTVIARVPVSQQQALSAAKIMRKADQERNVLRCSQTLKKRYLSLS